MDEANRTYNVVTYGEAQYSNWLADRKNALGWRN
ncbi:MbtH family NRPS accessory protein [Aliikangiella coralliicola]